MADRILLAIGRALLPVIGMAVMAGAQPVRSPHGAIEQACIDCHTTTGWQQIRYDHGVTGFPLEGGHAGVDCVSCHRLDDFTSDPACMTCHVDSHQGALSPECAECHEPEDWQASRFEHELTAFPLWGAHDATDCVQCHPNEETWQIASQPQMCFDCHDADFSSADVIVHQTAGPDCETCHTLDTWRGGHDPMWFEIRSGPHEVSCERCHQRPPDFVSYTCVDCHRFELEVREHVGVPEDDARCLDCHSRGGFGDD